MRQDRADRNLILFALLILIGSVWLFYFDGWMWSSPKLRGDRIGVVATGRGDVRVKFAGELKWQKATAGQELVFNDSIYAGGASEVDLKLGDSNLKVNENTLVVLRREKNVNFLNLSYGTLLGRLGKGQTIMIDTGDGKPVELSSVGGNTEIKLKKVGDKTVLDVVSGQAQVKAGNNITDISKDQRLSLDDKNIQRINVVDIKAIKPTRDQVAYSEEQQQIEFAWAFEDGRQVSSSDQFTLEFSSDASFAKIATQKTVEGALSTSLSVSQTLSMFYRVKGPSGAVSQVEQVKFVRMKTPLIVKPELGVTYQAIEGQLIPVELVFQKDQNASVGYQIASDAEFSNMIVNQNLEGDKTVHELGIGLYYLRARSDYGDGRLTGWGETRSFQVDKKVEEIRLTNARIPSKAVIVNRPYPDELYSSSDEKISEYLSEKRFLAKHFGSLDGQYDELRLKFEDDRKVVSIKDSAWPENKIQPGTFKFRYQLTKQGYLPSSWSDMKKLEISVEPPKPVGDTTYGEAMSDGRFEARWKFTPVLFARTYDVEIANNTVFDGAKEIHGSSTEVQVPLPHGQYYWRIRARDSRGRIISDFSPAYPLSPMPEVVPQMLAADENDGRNPAEENEPLGTTTTRLNDVAPELAWTRTGWWTWMGSGLNYVDYRQSVPGRLGLDYQNIKGPGQYLEAGYWAKNDTGYLITYKNTPGEVRIKNASLDVPSYSWTTLSLEVLKRRTAKFKLLGSRVMYGLRAGIQQHRTPFIFIDAFGDAKMRTNEMDTASVGFLSEMKLNRWTYYGLMRYQFPFSSRATQAKIYDLTPVFAFDGSVGASYNFSQQVKLGFFWYGQLHQYGFAYGNDDVLNEGSQSLFYSSMDLRLGVDF